MGEPSSELSLLESIQPSSPPDFETIRRRVDPPSLATAKPKIRINDKLDDLLDVFSSKHLTLERFLSCLETRAKDPDYGKTEKYRRPFNSFKKYAYRSLPSRCKVRQELDKATVSSLREWAFDIVGKELQTEIQTLHQHEIFGKWTSSITVGFESFSFDEAPEVISTRAPGWSRLFRETTAESGSHDNTNVKTPDFMILAMLCRRARPRRSDKTAVALGVYLYHAGLRRRALDSLAGLGICVSYRSVLRDLERMESVSTEEVRRIGQDSLSVPTYDNFEWSEGRRGERLGDGRPGVRSITTALVVQDRLRLTSPLGGATWQPQRHLLLPDEMARDSSRGVELIGRQMRRYHIEVAIKSVLADERAVASIDWTTPTPVIERLPPEKTNFVPLRPILKNESFTADNIQIMEDIIYKQFKMQNDDYALVHGFRMFAGDLKTWDRMQSVKAIRGQTSRIHRAHSFQWLIPTIGFWHLEYNMAILIHRLHWGVPVYADQSHLQFAADRWNRKQATDGKNYEAVVELLLHSYNSRIVGTLLAVLKSDLELDVTSIEDLRNWLLQQNTWSIDAVLSKVESRLSPLQESLVVDSVYANHQRFCEHVEAFMTLRYAIKHADIAILRHALMEATIMMLPREARTPRYARSLLYTWHLVASPAADKRLQDYVLANSIVNLQGKADTNFELDRLLELLNGKLKRFQKERTHFAADSQDELFQRWALILPILDQLQHAIETPFGMTINGRHIPKQAHEDIFTMATLLSTSSLEKPVEQFSIQRAPDLFRLGAARLGDAVSEYNEQYASDPFTDEDMEMTLSDEQPTLAIPESALATNNPIQDDEHTTELIEDE